MPLLEAAASGLPVVATGWSGHTDFLNQGKYISIDPKLTPIHKSRVDDKIFVSGAKWAEVDEKEVKQKLRKFFEKPTIPQQWAQDMSTTIREKYCLDSIKKLYSGVFNNLELSK